jgi:UTP:GlnB (protein PII) uridylyltransferase
MSDIIQGLAPVKSMKFNENKQAQVVISADTRSHLVLIGVNARDRPGLLLDISKCLLRLDLQLHRSEAAVLEDRSVSVWRCTYMENRDRAPDEGEISAVLSVSLVIDTPIF